MKDFNVITVDINTRKVEHYNIMPYLIRVYNNLKKDKPVTFNECREFIKKESMYQWWSRCEYEIIIQGWPNKSIEEKWDVHKQIMMNIDIITQIFIENIK